MRTMSLIIVFVVAIPISAGVVVAQGLLVTGSRDAQVFQDPQEIESPADTGLKVGDVIIKSYDVSDTSRQKVTPQDLNTPIDWSMIVNDPNRRKRVQIEAVRGGRHIQVPGDRIAWDREVTPPLDSTQDFVYKRYQSELKSGRTGLSLKHYHTLKDSFLKEKKYESAIWLGLKAGRDLRQKLPTSSWIDILNELDGIADSLGDPEKRAYVSAEKGRIFMAAGNHQRAQNEFENQIQVLEKSGKGDLLLFQGYRDLAFTKARLGHFDEVHELELKIEALKSEISPEFYVDLAALNMLLGNFEKAHARYNEALRATESLAYEKLLRARALTGLASADLIMGKPTAFKSALHANLICNKFAADSLQEAESLRILGAISLKAGLVNDARDHLKRALLLNQNLDPNGPRIPSILTALGGVELFTGEPDMALKYLMVANNLHEKSGLKGLEAAVTHQILGQTLQVKGQYKEAKEFFAVVEQTCKEAEINRQSFEMIVESVTPLDLAAPIHSRKMGLIPDVYWNFWWLDDGNRVETPSYRNTKERQLIDLQLDLAPFRYDEILKGDVQSGAAGRKVKDREESKQRINVIAMVISGPLELYNTNFKPRQLIEIDLDLLRKPLRQNSLFENKDCKDIECVRSKLSATKVVGSGNSPAHFQFEVLGSGCGVIGLSVWDGEFNESLDRVLYHFNVKAEDEKKQKCDYFGVNNFQISSGLKSLLDSGYQPAFTNPTDTKLHILEATDNIAMALFIDNKDKHYLWQLDDSFSKYLDSALFKTHIYKARDNKGDYTGVAKALKLILFKGKNIKENDGDEQAKSKDEKKITKAEKAFRSLKAIVENAPDGKPAVLYAKLTTADGRSPPIPLELLGAQGKKPILEKPFRVYQTMQIHRPIFGSVCIQPWFIAIPKQLAGVEGLNELHVQTTQGLSKRLSDEEELDDYFSHQRANTPEGLLLLAHQGEGYLYFSDVYYPLQSGSIQRKFAPGSVAFLDMCSAGSIAACQRGFRDKINALGVDTMIVSPFFIRGDVGTVLALNFAKEIEFSWQSGREPTIRNLLDTAVQKTAKMFADDKKDKQTPLTGSKPEDLGEFGLEFVIIGNPELKLCTKTGSSQ